MLETKENLTCDYSLLIFPLIFDLLFYRCYSFFCSFLQNFFLENKNYAPLKAAKF